MEAKELRLGNYFLDKDFTIQMVSSITESSIFVKPKYEFIGTPTSWCNPIPLTEQWHNDFGVYKTGFSSFEYPLPNNMSLYLTIVFTGDYVMLRQGLKEEKRLDDNLVTVWNKDLMKRDMYVHEFQNLYKLLSGTELTLKQTNQ